MKFKLLVVMLILFITNNLLFAVPGGGHIKMTPVGTHLYKKVSKSTVSWDLLDLQVIGPGHIHEWNVDSGTFIIKNISPTAKAKGTLDGAFNKSIDHIDILFDGPGSFEVEVTIKYTLKGLSGQDLADQIADEPEWGICRAKFSITLQAELKKVILEAGPSWSPVGTNVMNKPFEIEKNNLFTLKAITDPSVIDAELITWSGDNNINGTGDTKKDLKFDTFGIKNIIIKVSGIPTTVIIYVNDNASAPFTPTIGRTEKWAHCGDESITLNAGGTDFDWVKGALDSNNNKLDLNKTIWNVPPGFGDLDKKIGKVVKWTPAEDSSPKLDFIIATFEDNSDSYAPRDESYINQPVEVGAFKVMVQCIVTTSNNQTYISTLDEDDNFTGELPTNVGGLFGTVIEAQAKASDQVDASQITKIKDYKILTEWKFLTIPAIAIPPSKGTINADLSVEGSARFVSSAVDDDEADNPIPLQVGISGGVSWLQGSIAYTFTINDGDPDEAVAICAASFQSDSGTFTNNSPEEEPNHLYFTSKNCQTDRVQELKQKDWQKEKQSLTHTKKKDESVKSVFYFHAEARAKNNPTFIEQIDTRALASIEAIKAIISFEKIKYKP